tara:strand:- start:5246 stop:5821 length:576 start_codon:yes stop_codon:yes gene_type:complete
MSEAEEGTKITDWYLNEEDKDQIVAKSGKKTIRALPGSEKFLLYAEANRVKKFVDNGSYYAVIGFGVDFFINRGFSHDWEDMPSRFDLIEKTRNTLLDLVEDGHTFDESQLDKLYAWLNVSPYEAMAMTEPIRRQLINIVDIMWTSCVMKGKAHGVQSNDTAHTMMIDTLHAWSDRVVIPFKGVGVARLLS